MHIGMKLSLNVIGILIIHFQVNGYPVTTEMPLLQKRPYENPQLEEGDMLFPDTSGLIGRSAARRGASVPWTNGIVPYEILPGYASTQQSFIISTMQKMERVIAIHHYQCIQFRERISTDPYYITITNGVGCSSYIGQNTGINMTRTVTLQHPGCIYEGIIMHELLHVLGFFHEQSRPDRDNYVRINYQNIQAGMHYNFEKHSIATVDTLNTPYDYRSVMHYQRDAFSANGLPTIEPLVPNTQIGQRDNMSAIDIQAVRLFYNCTGFGVTLPPTPDTLTVSFNVQNTVNSSWIRDTPRYFRYSGSGPNYHYERYRIIVPQTGFYIFRSDSPVNTFGYFYSSLFSPSNTYYNLIAYDDDSGGNQQFQMQMYLRANFTYELVATTFKQYTTGSYSIIISGLNPVSIEKAVESSPSTTSDSGVSIFIPNKFCCSLILLAMGYFFRNTD